MRLRRNRPLVKHERYSETVMDNNYSFVWSMQKHLNVNENTSPLFHLVVWQVKAFTRYFVHLCYLSLKQKQSQAPCIGSVVPPISYTDSPLWLCLLCVLRSIWRCNQRYVSQQHLELCNPNAENSWLPRATENALEPRDNETGHNEANSIPLAIPIEINVQ